MEKLVVPEPTTIECGGKILNTKFKTGDINEHIRSWSGPLASDTARRLTRDKTRMNRIARRHLARRRKFLQERKRILAERRAELIRTTYDKDLDGWISASEFRALLSDVLPNSPPSDEEIALLMQACSVRISGGGKPGSFARVHPSSTDTKLTPAEALTALGKYERVMCDVATVAVSVAGI